MDPQFNPDADHPGGPLDRILANAHARPEPNTPSAAILDAARGLFAERGFAGTSIRSIAQAAGVNLAMVHYYFGNKEKLYGRVVEFELTELFRILRDNLAGRTVPHDMLAALPGFILALHRQRPELIKLLLREMTDGAPRVPTLVRSMGENGPLGLRTLLFPMIEAAQEGAVDRLPPAHLLAIFLSIGHGLMAFAPLIAEVFSVDLSNPQTTAAVAETASTVVRRALTPMEEA